MNAIKTARPGKSKAKNNIGAHFYTKPAGNYLSITCPLNAENKSQVPNGCWRICGLACAAICFRAPDAICEGCPCLAIAQ